jgi:hypothetical protein
MRLLPIQKNLPPPSDGSINNTKPNLTFHFSRRPTVAFILVRRESRVHIYIYGLRITVCINSFSNRDIETGIYREEDEN